MRMGFLQRIRDAFRPQANVRRDQPLRNYRWLWPDQPAGITITNDTALQISVVWACVEVIASSIAASQWNVFALEGRNRTLLPDDPLDYILNTRPNSEMTAIAVKEVVLFGALTWGNGYAEIQRTASGKVAALWPLMPDRVMPRRDPETGVMYYEYLQDSGGIARLEQQDVYHLRGPGISGLMGDNLVARAAKTISLAAAQERYASTYFGNNTIIGGVLKHPGRLGKEAHELLRTDFEDRYSGASKSNKPLLLEEGMDWLPISNNADEAQLVPSRQLQVEEICRWFKVPPHKIQHLLRATNNNIEHQGLEFSRDTLTPWSKRLEQEADFKLFSARGPWRRTKIDLAWLSQGDFGSRMTGYQIGRRMGVYSINEIREKEGDNHIGPAGDVRIVEINMQTLEQLEAGGPAALLASQNPPAVPAANDDSAETEADAAADSPDGAAEEMAPSAKADLVRASIVALFEGAFDRHSRRLKNREADLRRGGASDEKIAGHMVGERERARLGLLDATATSRDLAAQATKADPSRIERETLFAADKLDNGITARTAAEQLIAALETPC
jgi:HK97 family phage portal protein